MDSATVSRRIARNVAKIAENKPAPKRAKISFLTDAESQAPLAALDGTRMHTLALLALSTGMRRGEILGLRWSDSDMDAAELTVAQSLEQTRAGLRFKVPKTEASQCTITLPAVTVERLRRHRATQAKERLALGLGKSELVFTPYDGAIVNPRNFSKEFERMATGAGFPDLTFHGLRHSHATSLLNAGFNAKIVSERLGHASVVVTPDIYAKVLLTQTAEVAERIDSIFGSAG